MTANVLGTALHPVTAATIWGRMIKMAGVFASQAAHQRRTRGQGMYRRAAAAGIRMS